MIGVGPWLCPLLSLGSAVERVHEWTDTHRHGKLNSADEGQVRSGSFLLLANAWHRSPRRVAMVLRNFAVFDERPNFTSEMIISTACSIDFSSVKRSLTSNNDSKQLWRTNKFSSFDKRTSKGNIMVDKSDDLSTTEETIIPTLLSDLYLNGWATAGSFWQAIARISALVSLMKFLNTGNTRASTLKRKTAGCHSNDALLFA